MTKPRPRYEFQSSYLGAKPGDWVNQAACVGLPSEIFFPEGQRTSQQAKAVCGTCPVASECAEFALTTRERYGVWGGTSEPERHKLLGIRPKVH